MLTVDAPTAGGGGESWAPGSAAFVCIRPHTVQVGSTTDNGAMRARVAAHVWRGASTRLSLAIEVLPDQLIEADVPGRVDYPPDSIVGVTFPEPAGVLVAAAKGAG
jgi:2-aminoethylphosphonate transport system ATP-binding protein